MTATNTRIAAGEGARIFLATICAAGLTMDTPRIYLAGPMTGLPDLNYPAFHAEADRLRSLGYHVENPAETPEMETYEEYIRHGLARLVTCDQVALLPDWESSGGAFKERMAADWMNIPCQMAHEITKPASESAFA